MSKYEVQVLEHYVTFGNLTSTCRYFGVSKDLVNYLYKQYSSTLLFSIHAKNVWENEIILDKYKSKNLTISYGL